MSRPSDAVVLARIAAAVAAAFCGFLIPPAHWPAHGLLICLLLAAFAWFDISWRYVAQRVAILVPFWLLLALGVDWRSEAGRVWIATLALRGGIAFLAGLWLVRATAFPDLLAVLARGGTPPLLLAILGAMQRNVDVLSDELRRMERARRARTFGAVSWASGWSAAGRRLGLLVIRALNRAERIHGAMCARGWTGAARRIDFPPQTS